MIDFEKVTGYRTEAEEMPLVMTKPAHLDAAIIKEVLAALYSTKIDQFAEIVSAHEVNTDETEKMAVEMAGKVKKLFKEIEHERKETINEPYSFVREINGLCKAFTERLKEIEANLKQKIGSYQWKKELDRRKKEKIAQEAAKKLQKQVEDEAKKAGVEAPPIEAPKPVVKKETVTRTESGASAHIRTIWKMTKIVNFSKVPDKYKILDTKKVNAAIKAGIREIPGLKIEEVPETVLRG